MNTYVKINPNLGLTNISRPIINMQDDVRNQAQLQSKEYP